MVDTVKHHFTHVKHHLLVDGKPQWDHPAMLDADQLKDRFLRATTGIPAARVAAVCQVTPQAVSQWKRTGRIDKKHFNALSELTGRPLAYWLGEDDPTLGIAFSRRPVDIPAYEIRGVDDDTAESSEDVMVDMVDVELSAGAGRTAPEFRRTKRKLAYSRTWLLKKRLRESDLVVMPVRGDSMLPRLADGDAVLINRADTRIVDGKVYALVLGREAKIKTLRRGVDGSLIVISENPDKRMYPDEIVSDEALADVYIIGRAVQRSGDL